MFAPPPTPSRSRAAGEPTRCESDPPCAAKLPASATTADCPAGLRAATPSPRPATIPGPRPQRPRSRRTFGLQPRAPAASIPATGARRGYPRALLSPPRFFRRAAHHLPHLDRHASSHGPRSWRRGEPRGNLVGFFGALHIDDPVAGQELLRFRKHAVRDGLCVLAGANHFGLIGKCQSLGSHEHPSILELFAESAHECDVRLEILLGPLGVALEIGLGACHQQHVFHFDLPSIRAPGPSATNSSPLPVMICRTSIGMLVGTPPGPGPADNRAAIW